VRNGPAFFISTLASVFVVVLIFATVTTFRRVSTKIKPSYRTTRLSSRDDDGDPLKERYALQRDRRGAVLWRLRYLVSVQTLWLHLSADRRSSIEHHIALQACFGRAAKRLRRVLEHRFSSQKLVHQTTATPPRN
jgi:hypothetical protein